MLDHDANRQSLINDCLAFCESNGIGRQTFGQKYLKDRKFISRLEGGGWCRPETEAKIRAVIGQPGEAAGGQTA